MMARTSGPMSEGNWSVAVYVDERADEQQRAALEQIFTGAVGGPLGGLAPLISTVLGEKLHRFAFLSRANAGRSRYRQ
jgi:hypothetical protein